MSGLLHRSHPKEHKNGIPVQESPNQNTHMMVKGSYNQTIAFS
jgi:hypothetical protein